MTICRAMLLVLVSAATAVAQNAFQVGDVVAQPGTVSSGRIEIAAGESDSGTFVPVTVVRGARPGPVLGLMAGVHGSEYSPILALQRLRPLLGASELAGTVVMVHVANMPAFLGRTVYVGPVDGKNLNRSFPGRADGTLTERIAHALLNEVIAKSDYLMDIHSGDANESLRPSYTAYYAEAGGPDVIAASKRMAIAFGLDTIVEFQGGLESVDAAIWCGSAAVVRGVPSIDVESGELGLVEDERITPIVDGVLSVMRELGMIAGEPSRTASPLFVRERAYVESDRDGIWTPDTRVLAGQYVPAGARLGVVTDFFGNVLFEARAPAAGIVLVLLGTPPVNARDTLAVIAPIDE